MSEKYYTVIIPLEGKPYMKECKEYCTDETVDVYQLSSGNIGISLRRKGIRLCVLFDGSINDIKNFIPKRAEICENDDFHREHLKGLDREDAEYILTQLVTREYYLWNKPPKI